MVKVGEYINYWDSRYNDNEIDTVNRTLAEICHVLKRLLSEASLTLETVLGE
jgi:hypothetical protein